MSDFWARRKAAVEAEAAAEVAAVTEAEIEAREAELDGKTDAELLSEAGMPEPETLESAEAVQDFLKSELPRRLKTRALRRLWRLNPVLANLDGLVDYGEDYTDSATVIENMQTVYQVGKGMFDKAEEMARSLEEKARAAAQADETELSEDVREDEPLEETPQDLAHGDAPDLPVLPQDAQNSDAADAPSQDIAHSMPQRRMRFQFAAREG